MRLSSELHAAGSVPEGSPLSDDRLTFRWWHAAVAVLALIVIALVFFVTVQPVQVLPRMTLAPGYALTDQDGALLTSEDARGKFTLYTFMHTGCTLPACADAGPAARAIQERLATIDSGDVPVQIVTISFDPQRDTPEALKGWLEANGADAQTWHAATGAPDHLKNIIGGSFGAYYKHRDDGTFAFDPLWVLVDGNGITRARYKTAAPDPDAIARDVGLLAREVKNSTGAGRLAYEAAHLFACYPN